MIGFADDLAILVVAKHPESLELYGGETVNPIKVKLLTVKLDWTDEHAVLNTSGRTNSTVKIRIGNHEVASKSIIRYWG